MCSIEALGRVAVRLSVKQLREFFAFTDSPFLGMRSEKTHHLDAVQSNTPSALLADHD
jgi:hypothetical protein